MRFDHGVLILIALDALAPLYSTTMFLLLQIFLKPRLRAFKTYHGCRQIKGVDELRGN